MSTEHFDPIKTSLHQGISLIEASAGTGKTYTIAMLVLRLVVEQAIAIENILVVTFTTAATEELKDRIRGRLADAKRVLTNQTDVKDKTISLWLEQLSLSIDEIKQRLERALLDIDQAGIFTIHGFCQRILREHALASGQLFDAQLTEDLTTIKQACTDDFWRRQVQTRSVWEVSALTHNIKSPDILLKSISAAPTDAEIFPALISISDSLTDLKTCADAASQQLDKQIGLITPYLSSDHKSLKESFKKSFADHIETLTDWLTGVSPTFPSAEAFTLLTYTGLFDGLNGNQFRSNKDQTSEDRKQEFLDSLKINTALFDELAFCARQIPVLLRRNLLETLHQELDKQLEQNNLWSFDYLITHLAKALKAETGMHLASELRQRFQAALIDEFQDTDNHQWHIFSTIFTGHASYLFLVGDPKQAIYKFRGADIYSYLEAQHQAHYRYTLGFNWRSHPNLVEAVNTLFNRDDAFLLPDIGFHPTQAARTEQEGVIQFKNSPVTPMVLWQLPENDSKQGFWQPNRNDAENLIGITVVNEIVALLNEDYYIQPDNKRIKPQDIAILVRTNLQAVRYQDALRAAQIPAVLNSKASVFASGEALSLLRFLQAIAHPGDMRLFRQALALDWFGMDGQTFYQMFNNENDIDVVLTRFLEYLQIWQRSGIMTLMQNALQNDNIANNLSKSVIAERRLTNLQHILELLQEAVIEERLGIHKTLNWLSNAIHQALEHSATSENQQLRLESDAEAVKIITMHRSKGLEYPIVFCPFLWQRKDFFDAKNPLVICHPASDNTNSTNALIVDLGSTKLEKHREQAEFEDRAEELRIAYVALTRAKYRCYVAWADARTEAKPNDSALAWLLNFSDKDFALQQTILQSLSTKNAQHFSYRLLDLDETITASYQQPANLIKLIALKRKRYLQTNWQMTSYTALAAYSTTESPELPRDKADELDYKPENFELVLPSGAHTGNVVHELLENIPFFEFAKNTDITILRDKACKRYGLQLSQPKLLDALLFDVVSTPLSSDDPNFCLKNLTESYCLKEMPFYLAMPTLDTQLINAVLQAESSFQPLTDKAMSGFLTGFIDLICCYKHRYYIMDYKTNTLPDYDKETLSQAMLDHNYGLQYWLYAVVLHRYLKSRVPNYSYPEHFGGVRYLFVRGMKPNQSLSGVFADFPRQSTLEALAELFEVPQ